MYVDELIQIVDGQLLNKLNHQKITGFSVDTRTIEKGNVFLCLTSDHGDGHDHIKEAISKSSCIIVSKEVKIKTKVPIILVEDVNKALLQIGSYYRKKYPVFSIAITGSNGKTTTKEILYHILSKKYKVLKSEKNYNNHIGVPLTLTQLNHTHEVLLLELGMNHRGEIRLLSNLVKPHLSLITNIGSSHIGNLGSKKNIFKAKMEIVEGMEDGVLLVNGNDPYLKKVKTKKQYDVVLCGYHSSYGMQPYHVKATLDNLSFSLFYLEREYKIEVPVLGKHFLADICLAIEASLLLGLTMEEIVTALSSFSQTEKRMHKIEKNGYTVIDDCYNASYDSFAGFIDLLKETDKKKILVVGDMLELGRYSEYYHKKLGKKLRKLKNIKILLVGEQMNKLKGKNMIHFSSIQMIIQYLHTQTIQNRIIAFKASRKMHLEAIIHSL